MIASSCYSIFEKQPNPEFIYFSFVYVRCHEQLNDSLVQCPYDFQFRICIHFLARNLHGIPINFREKVLIFRVISPLEEFF